MASKSYAAPQRLSYSRLPPSPSRLGRPFHDRIHPVAVLVLVLGRRIVLMQKAVQIPEIRKDLRTDEIQ